MPVDGPHPQIPLPMTRHLDADFIRNLMQLVIRGWVNFVVDLDQVEPHLGMQPHDVIGVLNRLPPHESWPHGVQRWAIERPRVRFITLGDDRLETGSRRAHAEDSRHPCVEV